MHSFLKTVGFRNVKSRKDVEQLVRLIIEQGTERYMTTLGSKNMFAEILLEVTDRVGVALRGEYDEHGKFHMEHYFPYVKGETVSSNEVVFINKRVDTDAYTGMCEDFLFAKCNRLCLPRR